MSAIDSPDPEERPLRDRLRSRFGVALGLLFLIGPISDLAGSSLSPARKAGIAVVTALFVALYWSLLPPVTWLKRRGEAWVAAVLALMPAIATVILLAGAPKSFVALFVYFVVVCGMLLPERIAVVVVGGTAVCVGIASAAWGASGGEVAALVLTTVALGVMMSAFGRIARGNRELRAARHELARLAVSEERIPIFRARRSASSCNSQSARVANRSIRWNRAIRSAARSRQRVVPIAQSAAPAGCSFAQSTFRAQSKCRAVRIGTGNDDATGAEVAGSICVSLDA